jgi:hypothetical protein
MKRKFNSEEERRLAKNERERRYYEKNDKEVRLLICKKYREKNKEILKMKRREYYQKHKEEFKSYAKNYNKNHKEERNIYYNNRIKTDINFKLSCGLRCRLNKALRGNQKSGSAVQDLGCSIPEFKLYLKSKWKDGMNWDNYGFYGWHIDHIIPLDFYDLQNREEFLKACHYTNLQPLWAEENITKGNKIVIK